MSESPLPHEANEPPKEAKHMLDRHIGTALGKDLESRFSSPLSEIETAVTQIKTALPAEDQDMFIEPMTEALAQVRKTSEDLQTQQPYLFEEAKGRFKLRFQVPSVDIQPQTPSYTVQGEALQRLRMGFEDSYNNTFVVFVGYAEILQQNYSTTLSSHSTETIVTNALQMSEFINSIQKKKAIEISTDKDGNQQVTYVPKQDQETTENPPPSQT